MSESELEKVAGAMQPKEFMKDDIIIRYGDLGKEYYVLAKGDVQVIVYEKGAKPNDPDKKIAFTKVMNPGVGFGEIALIYNDKRSATIQSIEDKCLTYVLDGNLFKTIIIKTSQEKRQLALSNLNQIKIFGKYAIFIVIKAHLLSFLKGVVNLFKGYFNFFYRFT